MNLCYAMDSVSSTVKSLHLFFLWCCFYNVGFILRNKSKPTEVISANDVLV